MRSDKSLLNWLNKQGDWSLYVNGDDTVTKDRMMWSVHGPSRKKVDVRTAINMMIDDERASRRIMRRR